MRYMTFEQWEKTAASPFASDPIWRMSAFRMALYVLDEAWRDMQVLRRYPLLDPTSSQLYKAVGSIGANIGEGYGRSSGLDRARLYEYSLGSTRESQVWYFACRHVMDEAVLAARNDSLVRIAKILSHAIPQERRRSIRRGST
jgi:four helix bundle protein